jgi:hypothetical protein
MKNALKIERRKDNMKIENIFYVASSTIVTTAIAACTLQTAITTIQYAIKFFKSLYEFGAITDMYFHATIGAFFCTVNLIYLTYTCFSKAYNYYQEKYDTVDLSKKSIDQIEGAANTLGV